MATWRKLPASWTAVPLFLLFFWLALNSLALDSPTMDEQNHLARGLAFLRSGDPRLSLEHPPLVNSLSALPLLTLPDVHLPFDDVSWTKQEPPGLYWYFFADLLLWVYNHDVTRMVFLARLPIVFLTLGLGLVTFHSARELWGQKAALLALFLLLLEPNVLAHGRLATTDLGGTLFVFLAAYLLWRLWQADGWSWPRWAWLALALGLAFGSKLSTLAFVPIFGLLAFLPHPQPRHGRFQSVVAYGRGVTRRLGQLVLAGLLSLLVVWVIFGGQWGFMQFQSAALTGLNGRQGPMPIFWAGIEQILLLSGGGRPSFLLGHFSDTGFLSYFPIAFLVKTPLAVLSALPLASFVLLKSQDTRTRALFLLLPALLYLLLSMQSGLNIGYRHLLPILPFLLVLISGLVTHGQWPGVGSTSRPSVHGLRLAAYGLALLLLFETLAIHPHYLSFFNQAAGGPAHGHTILIDSNIDWGQDLRRLKAWLDDNGVTAVKLGWFGTARPDYYAITYQPLPGLGGVGQPAFFDAWWQPLPFNPTAPEPGVYAISATSLWEFPRRDEDKTAYAWFRHRPPDARIGYSIFIYEVKP